LKLLLGKCDTECEDCPDSAEIALQDLMMHIRKTLVAIVGLTQSVIALLSVVLACSIHFNLFSTQETLDELLRSVPMTAPILLVFGLLSTASGLLLIREWLELL